MLMEPFAIIIVIVAFEIIRININSLFLLSLLLLKRLGTPTLNIFEYIFPFR